MADEIHSADPVQAPVRERSQRSMMLIASMTAMAALGSSAAAGYALVYTRDSVEATRDQVRLVEQGQITERYGRAVEQLGSSSLGVRVGGAFALERIMRDSPADQPTIVEVLTAFVRENTTRRKTPRVAHAEAAETLTAPVDIQAALTVVGRRDPAHDAGRRIDLGGANLFGVDLAGANLVGAELERADLTGASLFRANLADAHLLKANLTYTGCRYADFTNAGMVSAVLVNTYFYDANLTGAQLGFADMSRAYFSNAKLVHADLRSVVAKRTKFYQADLTGADLTGADLRGAEMEGADLTDTKR